MGESSSCQCSMTSIGQRKEIQKYVSRIPNKSRTRQKDSRVDTGHCSAQETKKNCMERTPERKWNSIAEEMVGKTSKNELPVFLGYQCVEPWNPEKKKAEDALLTSMRILRTRRSFCFAQITSANQLSNPKKQWRVVVKTWLQRIPGQDELERSPKQRRTNRYSKKKPEPQEVTSFEQTPRKNDEAVGNGFARMYSKT